MSLSDSLIEARAAFARLRKCQAGGWSDSAKRDVYSPLSAVEEPGVDDIETLFLEDCVGVVILMLRIFSEGDGGD